MNAGTRNARAAVAACFVVGALAAQLLLGAAAAVAGTWSSANCTGRSYAISTWKRSQAKAYAQEADEEGYEWGGGCYKLNDRDDTPGAPDSGGEGADCSGFTFKSWALRSSEGASGFQYHEHERFIHGPYSTADFASPCSSCPFRVLSSKSYAATTYMDAFVYRTSGAGHIGMIYAEGSGGTDLIVEAKSDELGTRIAWTDYRQQSAYRAVARTSWTPECYPRCT
ncbi:MAG TPA: hypothetical protein VNO17_01430 [Actinomycetota bacterium]|nr:hypothetical protein [Actinomycetota bacterium]